jgi:hypothetical protein
MIMEDGYMGTRLLASSGVIVIAGAVALTLISGASGRSQDDTIVTAKVMHSGAPKPVVLPPASHDSEPVESLHAEPQEGDELVLTDVAYNQEEEGRTGVRAFVEATTPGGAVVVASYELSLTFREDRWEVTDYWGAPSLAGRPTGEEAAEASDGTEDGDGADGS